MARSTKRLHLLAVATTSVVLMSGAAAKADDWRDMSNYPARVRAIQFDNPLDQSHWIRWGSWEVRFGPELPTAQSFVNGNSCQAVGVKGLSCSNAVSGTEACSFSFITGCGGRQETCLLGIQSISPIVVECPQGIQLAR
jgi:hypothetical protein